MSVTTATRTASPKQIALITRLYGERIVPVAGSTPGEARLIEWAFDAGTGKTLTGREASAVIDWLFTLPRQATEAAKPGYYVRQVDGLAEYIVIVQNKAGTSTYAKRLVVTERSGRKYASWEYAPGVGRSIAREGLSPLTVEEAAAFGHMHGFCMICCRNLTDPESVQRGIGPVCAKKLH